MEIYLGVSLFVASTGVEQRTVLLVDSIAVSRNELFCTLRTLMSPEYRDSLVDSGDSANEKVRYSHPHRECPPGTIMRHPVAQLRDQEIANLGNDQWLLTRRIAIAPLPDSNSVVEIVQTWDRFGVLVNATFGGDLIVDVRTTLPVDTVG